MTETLHYRSVMITGASAGLGEEFARQLAGNCDQMILIARREDRLLQLASDLKQGNPHLDVLHFAVDLIDREARTAFIQLLADHGARPDLLINNAGMGDYGEFAEADWPKLEQMLELNINALTHLTHALLPSMRELEFGDIINVSSLASILPIPDFAVYAATKAYVTSFSEAIRMELAESDINVMALCPGPVHTEFGTVAMRGEDKNKIPGNEFFYTPKEVVVAEAISGLIKGRARVYPSWKIGLAAIAISAIPIIGIRLLMGTRPRREA
ncbi:SDR family NAD(P)-dependent oxidoreductase [Rubritalea tangerina]|uniref:SDR family NAD(P)-dependent oxidoreductase n=1 Tax=Rubritalea tangerina TaxID=430798 RepID=A0ABW4Z8P0_9BACT